MHQADASGYCVKPMLQADALAPCIGPTRQPDEQSAIASQGYSFVALGEAALK